MRVIGKLNNQHGHWQGAWIFYCPGCQVGHMIRDRQFLPPGDSRPGWEFNGSDEKPTFSPSYLVNSTWKGKPTVCHSYIRDGMIQFLNDCTHALAGQTVPMEDYEIWGDSR